MREYLLTQSSHRYLGPQTEFNENLPTATFPTLDTFESLEARQRHQAIPPASKPFVQSVFNLNPQIVKTSDLVPTRSTYCLQDTRHKEPLRGRSLGILSSPINESMSESPTKTANKENLEAKHIWEKLSFSRRLEVVDSIVAAIYPTTNAFQALNRLPLTDAQIEAMRGMLRDRQDHIDAEDRAHMILNRGTTNYLMSNNVSVSEHKFKIVLDRTIYKTILPDNYLTTKATDLQNARSFLSRAGFSSELLDHDVPTFASLQQKGEKRVKQGEGGPPANPQPDRASEQHSAPQREPTRKPLAGEPALKPQIQDASVAPRTAPAAVLAHGSPPPPRGSARTWETKVPPPSHMPIRPLAQIPSASSIKTTPARKRTAGDVTPSLEEQTQRNNRAVSAAVGCDRRIQGGTALTGGGGSRGVDQNIVYTRSKPMGDLSFEDWASMMDRHFENGAKQLGRDGVQERMKDNDILGEYNFD